MKIVSRAWNAGKEFVNPIRPMIKFVKDTMIEPLTGVEIGVYEGRNAYNILSNIEMEKLYLIDPYVPYKEDKGWKGTKEVYKRAKKRLSPYRSKVVFITKFSEDAVDDIPDDVDFVYIDGNHAYEYVKKDIELYYPKVRSAGVIGGHDFYPGNGVPFAVVEFVKKHNLELYGKKSDWWVRKNE